MNTDRITLIRQRLVNTLHTEQIEIIDDSASHVGHVGARQGGGHYDVVIVAEVFEGLNKVARHRLVYEALADLMKSEIHALSINALTPEEMP